MENSVGCPAASILTQMDVKDPAVLRLQSMLGIPAAVRQNVFKTGGDGAPPLGVGGVTGGVGVGPVGLGGGPVGLGGGPVGLGGGPVGLGG